MKRSNKELVKTLINKVFNEHDFSVLDEIMRDDYIQHNPDADQGKKGFVEFFIPTFKAMPDFKYEIFKIITEGDIVMAYCGCSGTHTGGPWLEKPATGKHMTWTCVDIFRIQDGKIAEHWDVADTFELFRQLGIIDLRMGR